MLLRGFTVSYESVRRWEAKAAALDGRGVAQATSRHDTQLWPELVCRRNLLQGPRPLVLPVSGHPPRREPRRHAAERDP
jgi:hypothetical protein